MRMSGYFRHPAENRARDGSRGVGAIFDGDIGNTRQRVAAARGNRGMRIDDGLAPVELFENGRELGTTEPLVAIACQHADAIGFQRVETVFDFAQTGVGIRPRQNGPVAEAAGVIGGEAGGVFIAFARQTPRQGVIGERNTRRGDGGDDGGHTGLVHIFERPLGRPFFRDGRSLVGSAERRNIGGWIEVMMNIDNGPRGFGGSRAGGECRASCESAGGQCGKRLQHVAPIRIPCHQNSTDYFNPHAESQCVSMLCL